jgi:nucleoside-diphosphate-sugar epimerase
MDRLKILITGKNGYIASSLIKNLKNHLIISIGRDDFDLKNENDTIKWFSDKYFDVVIHTAVSGGNRLKEETSDVLMDNLLMYENLIKCRNHFNKFIHFGSGAEETLNTPYAFSKRIINKLMKLDDNSINIKIYAVFDENELNQRFIKGNIIRYIQKENMIIHQDKKMDFFYMKDLISLIDWLITNNTYQLRIKNINCTYSNTYSLKEIANFINQLDSYNVGIDIHQSNMGIDYFGNFSKLPINFIGLEKGIIETYNKLKCSI